MSILVALCCVIVVELKPALAAGDNQLTVNATDDCYGKPI